MGWTSSSELDETMNIQNVALLCYCYTIHYITNVQGVWKLSSTTVFLTCGLWKILLIAFTVCWIQSDFSVISLEQAAINPSTFLGCLYFATKNRYGGNIFHSPLTSLRISLCVRIKVSASQLENNQPPVVLLHRLAIENILQKSHLTPELVMCAEALFA